MDGPRPGAEDRAVVYLGQLGEETMRAAWGEETPAGDRRRIVTAAIIFGRQFEERAADAPAGEDGARRLLMDLMNAVIREFAAREDMTADEAAGFLGEVGVRDRVLEFSEVLDEYEASGRPLDDLLGEAVKDRRDKAFRSR